MQFVKQRTKLPIQNIDLDIYNEKEKRTIRKHGSLLPNNIRCLICGPSNCGKTNVIISLLLNPNGLRFKNIYIYSRSLSQPKYEYLRDIISKIGGMGCYTFACNDMVISTDRVKPHSVFIFDDVICDKQKNIQSYFCMGRHKDVDCFYLTQSYTHVPKHLIRENVNLLILFKQDQLNLKHVYNDFCIAADMSFESFIEMCNKCWDKKFNFLVIDTESEMNKGRYRKGFDEFIYIK